MTVRRLWVAWELTKQSQLKVSRLSMRVIEVQMLTVCEGGWQGFTANS